MTTAAVLTLGGLLVRLDELFPIALAAVVLVGAALVWVRARSWRVEGRRSLVPVRVALGGVARVQLSVTNQGRRTSPVLSARDPFDGGRRFARFVLSPLAPGTSVTASYRLPTTQRGVFAVGPLEFRLEDPFGLAAVSRRSAGRSMLRVHPAFDPVPPLQLRGVSPDGTQLGAVHPTQHGEEFYALREYQLGDDLRRVHWASSARADQLMIREDQDPAANRLLLVGDLRASLHTPASLETALSVLASLADAGIRGGHSVRLVCSSGADSGWGAGANHALAILDLLASATLDPARLGTSPGRCRWDHGRAATSVVVSTDGITPEDLAAPAQRGPHGGTVVAVERPGHQAGPLPCAVVRMTPGMSFPAAWVQRPALLG